MQKKNSSDQKLIFFNKSNLVNWSKNQIIVFKKFNFPSQLNPIFPIQSKNQIKIPWLTWHTKKINFPFPTASCAFSIEKKPLFLRKLWTLKKRARKNHPNWINFWSFERLKLKNGWSRQYTGRNPNYGLTY